MGMGSKQNRSKMYCVWLLRTLPMFQACLWQLRSTTQRSSRRSCNHCDQNHVSIPLLPPDRRRYPTISGTEAPSSRVITSKLSPTTPNTLARSADPTLASSSTKRLSCSHFQRVLLRHPFIQHRN